MSRLTPGGIGSVTSTIIPSGTQDVNLIKVGGTSFSLGQQLAAASLPVVLTAAQISTLTPLATVAATQSGTWNIGTVTTVTAVTAISNALPTGSNLIGYVGHGKTPKFKTGSASATFTIVAAVASKKIKVYSLSLMTASTTAVTVTFKDGAAGTALGTYILQAITGTNFGITENLAIPSSLFETTAATLLEMAFSAAVSVTYNLRYWDDDAT